MHGGGGRSIRKAGGAFLGAVLIACLSFVAWSQAAQEAKTPIDHGERFTAQGPTPEGQSQEATTQQEANPARANPPTNSIKSKGGGNEAGPQSDETTEERENRDLAAQESMARSSIWQVVVGFAALIGLGVTIYYTRKTTKAAIRATDAAVASAKTADDTFKISKLTMEAGNRAYVQYERVTYVSHMIGVPGQLFWRFRAHWTNSGNTPTRQLLSYVNVEIRDTPLPDDYAFAIDPAVVRIPTFIGPKAAIVSAPKDISADDLLAVQQGTKHLYVWGVVNYRDVFPDTPDRVTRFCIHAVAVMGFPRLEWNQDTNKVDIVFLFHSRHNCQDEDCS